MYVLLFIAAFNLILTPFNVFELQMEIFDLKKKTLLSLSEEDATPNSASQPLPASEIA